MMQKIQIKDLYVGLEMVDQNLIISLNLDH